MGIALVPRGSPLIFVCDQRTSERCHERIETGCTDFAEAVAQMKRERWTVHRNLPPSRTYRHCCPRCCVPR